MARADERGSILDWFIKGLGFFCGFTVLKGLPRTVDLYVVLAVLSASHSVSLYYKPAPGKQKDEFEDRYTRGDRRLSS